jgi:ABC-type uncharacterized transport system auxiliary subunit
MSSPRDRRPIRSPRRLPAFTAALAAALAAGCSLLPEPEPAPRVYVVPLAAAPARSATRPVCDLRLRAVTPAGHLDEGLAWCTGPQVGTREGARWAERPDVVLQRALLAQLFGDGRLVRSESLDAPLLDVELLAFEERLADDGAQAHVVLRARVLDAARREVLALDLQAQRPLDGGGDDAEALARGLGAGLDEVCARLAGEIVRVFGG